MKKKTTWNDFHSGNVEKKETPNGVYISEACGRSRVKTHCPLILSLLSLNALMMEICNADSRNEIPESIKLQVNAVSASLNEKLFATGR